jgi:UDP-galactopyranose mutase
VDELIGNIDQDRCAFWYYTPMALDFTRHHRPRVIVYDNMDELSAFRGASPRLLELERELFALADVIFTGGLSLYEAKRERHSNIHAFPSSIDVQHFVHARSQHRIEPSDQRELSRPRLGFFGVIDERFDTDLVAQLAAQRPSWQLVMIGPVAKIDPVSLPRLPNIHWLGCKNYSDLPSYIGGWDVGIMPFAINEATRFISPTKTPEFLAAGVPVVSTPVTDVVRPYGKAGLVEIASTAEEFVSKTESLLSRKRTSWLAAVDRELAKTSWDKTWTKMQELNNSAAIHPCQIQTTPARVSEGIASAV